MCHQLKQFRSRTYHRNKLYSTKHNVTTSNLTIEREGKQKYISVFAANTPHHHFGWYPRRFISLPMENMLFGAMLADEEGLEARSF